MGAINHNNTEFNIDDEIQAKYPELIQLVLNTESMDDQEKQYWFDIMPSMDDSQIDRLFNILETERIKLEELEVKYQKEIKTLNEKHLIEWQELQMKDSKQKIADEEARDKKAGTDENADDILAMLDDL